MLNTIDSNSKSKHKLLEILYTKGRIVSNKKEFEFNDFKIEELSKYMNSDDIHSITKLLINSKDIEMTINYKSRITAYGVNSYIHKSYLKEYRKSIFEYIKNILQIAIFTTTIIFLVVDRFIEKPKIDKIEKAVIKLESENITLKQIIKSNLNHNSHRNEQCDTTKRDYNKPEKR